MQFEERRTTDCAGWHLAHSVAPHTGKLAKGHLLTTADVEVCIDAGHHTLVVFKLDPEDCDENTAAAHIAGHLSGAGCTPAPAKNGRVDITADADGVFLVHQDLIKYNLISEEITVATLADFSAVQKGDIICTVKIIPYAVPQDVLRQIQSLPHVLTVKAFTPFTAQLIDTDEERATKTQLVTEKRLQRYGAEISAAIVCPHETAHLANHITAFAASQDNVLLIAGKAAVSDRRDTVPAAIVAAGGSVVHLGMPMDPGNLMLVGDIGGKPVIGLPGCARSPAENGVDRILAAIAAGIPLDTARIAQFGQGGLIKTSAKRLRHEHMVYADMTAHTPLAIILAAGKSSRSGTTNKLLGKMDSGTTVLEQSVRIFLDAGIEVILITGKDHHAVETVIPASIRRIHNAEYASGMASSIKAGMAGLPGDHDAVFIGLGDMPFVAPETLKKLTTAAQAYTDGIFIPTFNGKRGNPVLWAKNSVELLANTIGDKGGKAIIAAHPELVIEVAVDDAGILIDLDTPQALEQFGVTRA